MNIWKISSVQETVFYKQPKNVFQRSIYCIQNPIYWFSIIIIIVKQPETPLSCIRLDDAFRIVKLIKNKSKKSPISLWWMEIQVNVIVSNKIENSSINKLINDELLNKLINGINFSNILIFRSIYIAYTTWFQWELHMSWSKKPCYEEKLH